MRGMNKVIISGNVCNMPHYGNTGNGAEVCSFRLVSDRALGGGNKISAWIKINVYGNDFVRVCRDQIKRGAYVLVEGELMNRDWHCPDGHTQDLVEVRAREIIFMNRSENETERVEENVHD